MADVYNRVTGEFRRSVNTPDFVFEGSDWFVAPRAAVEAIPEKYRKVLKGGVVEMNAAEKLAVDNARLAAAKESRKQALLDEALEAAKRDVLPAAVETKLATAEAQVDAAATENEVKDVKYAR